MSSTKVEVKNNIRHTSILKKTASRICATQVLYSISFAEGDINIFIKCYLDNYLPPILTELGIKQINNELFKRITLGVYNNILSIDQIISGHLSKKWTLNRLSETEKSVLRLGAFELCFDKKFKKNTIINEYVSIIEVFGGNPNFANGILENISK